MQDYEITSDSRAIFNTEKSILALCSIKISNETDQFVKTIDQYIESWDTRISGGRGDGEVCNQAE